MNLCSTAHTGGLVAPGAKECTRVSGGGEVTEVGDESVVVDLDGDLAGTMTLTIQSTTSLGPVLTLHGVQGTIAAEGGDLTTAGSVLGCYKSAT